MNLEEQFAQLEKRIDELAIKLDWGHFELKAGYVDFLTSAPRDLLSVKYATPIPSGGKTRCLRCPMWKRP